ncbi:MAG: type I-E CRISPR-associated protein Cas7/Cse4/CasC [Chloroflexia bacterium]|nr:type I-E CRISPR-associated protein Cas7/Cse4/CasC [Chloroflexia bacterium]
MFVELHVIQNFAPSNLNRDDTGAPKDAQFGGYRRARISSQCLKRAVRTYVRSHGLVPPDQLGVRTKRLVDALVEKLTERGHSPDDARPVIQALLAGANFAVKDDGKTEYLLFLGEREIAAMAELAATHWETLRAVTGPAPGDAAPGGRPSARASKSAGKNAVPTDVQNALRALLDGGKAVDLALFGRMLADLPVANIDAACQVAPALSTHPITMEFDYYTAVDDRLPDDTSGADMIGTVGFNSACFYRYANLDLRQLTVQNLGGDVALAEQAVRAFLLAAIRAVPTGKQNSMAAQNPPSFVLAVVRRDGLWSLANAFARPVRIGREGDVVADSIVAMDRYWGELVDMYGDQGILAQAAVGSRSVDLATLGDARVANVPALVDEVCAAAFPNGALA